MKALQIIRGMFRYTRTPAAQIDGGAAEYVFQQFQEYPPQDVLAGRGFLYEKNPLLTQGGLFVFSAVGAPIDVTKVPVGAVSLEEQLIEEDMLPQ